MLCWFCWQQNLGAMLGPVVVEPTSNSAQESHWAWQWHRLGTMLVSAVAQSRNHAGPRKKGKI